VLLCPRIILSAIIAPLRTTRRSPFRRAQLRWACVGGLLLGCEQLAGIESHEFAEPPPSTGGMTNDIQNEGGGEAGFGAFGDAGAQGEAGHSQGGTPTAGPSAPGPTGDNKAPFIVRAEPADTARGVAESAEIVIEFSEPMNVATVEREYFQKPGPGSLRWNDAHTELTVSAVRKPVRSDWDNANRSGADSDLAVSYGVGKGALDKAGNPMGEPFSAKYYLRRHVEHRLSLCLDLSGTASATSFEAGAPQNPSAPCVTSSDVAVTSLATGDRDGKEVVAVMSYSLGLLPLDVNFEKASLRVAFDKPVGNPHQLYGALELQDAAFGVERSLAFDAASRGLGVLAQVDVMYPYSTIKDVTETVAAQLASRPTTSVPLAQFRARFLRPGADTNGTPDYANLAVTTETPTLTVTYTCSACP
jgi:hypothetical protein